MPSDHTCITCHGKGYLVDGGPNSWYGTRFTTCHCGAGRQDDGETEATERERRARDWVDANTSRTHWMEGMRDG